MFLQVFLNMMQASSGQADLFKIFSLDVLISAFSKLCDFPKLNLFLDFKALWLPFVRQFVLYDYLSCWTFVNICFSKMTFTILSLVDSNWTIGHDEVNEKHFFFEVCFDALLRSSDSITEYRQHYVWFSWFWSHLKMSKNIPMWLHDYLKD